MPAGSDYRESRQAWPMRSKRGTAAKAGTASAGRSSGEPSQQQGAVANDLSTGVDVEGCALRSPHEHVRGPLEARRRGAIYHNRGLHVPQMSPAILSRTAQTAAVSWSPSPMATAALKSGTAAENIGVGHAAAFGNS